MLLPRALCRDDVIPSMDGLASDVTFSWLRYSFEDLFSKATMYKTRRPRLPASSEISFPCHQEEVPCLYSRISYAAIRISVITIVFARQRLPVPFKSSLEFNTSFFSSSQTTMKTRSQFFDDCDQQHGARTVRAAAD